MLAPPRTLARGPVFRRALTRSSIVGVGLVALGTAGLPAALADDESVETPTDESLEQVDGGETELEVLEEDVLDEDEDAVPAASIEGFFGSGKSVDIQVGYEEASAPAGLDLSGAVFTLSGGGGTYTCTTDESGACFLNVGRVAPGDYTVTQTAAPWGLAPAVGEGSVHMCSMTEAFAQLCGYAEFEPVVNDSLFHSAVVGSVEDSDTGEPVEGASYTLSGPDYVGPLADEEPELTPLRTGLDDEAASDTAVFPSVAATSAADGSLTFPGWFLAGNEYTLVPGDPAEGYEADAAATEASVTGTGRGGSATLEARLLDPIVEEEEPEGTGTSVPTATPTTTPAPAPVIAPVTPRVGAGAGAGTGTGAAQRGQAVPGAVASESSAAATPTSSAAARPTSSSRTSGPSAPPVARAVDEPQLSTVSSSLPDRGLVIAFGIVFLAVVLVGLALVRRHARNRG